MLLATTILFGLGLLLLSAVVVIGILQEHAHSINHSHSPNAHHSLFCHRHHHFKSA